MAKTAAERQKAYRQRRAQEAGEMRINTWVSAQALKSLNALAERNGVTQKVLLEQIILAAAIKPGRPAKAASHKTVAVTPGKRPAATTKVKPKPKPEIQAKARKASAPRRAAKPKAPVQASLWDDF